MVEDVLPEEGQRRSSTEAHEANGRETQLGGRRVMPWRDVHQMVELAHGDSAQYNEKQATPSEREALPKTVFAVNHAALRRCGGSFIRCRIGIRARNMPFFVVLS